MKTLGDRVNDRMVELGMKQEDLAKLVGISQPSVQRLISGKTKNPKKILELSKALKVTPEWLVNGTGEIVDIKNTPDPLAELTDIERMMLLRMQQLTEKQQRALLANAEELAADNQCIMDELLQRQQKQA